MSLKRLFVITGDASGDVHGSFVIRRLQELAPEVEIEAIGGERIASTGIPLFYQQQKLGVLGAGVIGAIPRHYLLGKKLIHYLKTWKPDAVLLIDYGMFNLHIAKHLKKMGIKVFFYIPPQIWAAKGWRIKSIKRFVDHVFCIFPFEKTLYDTHQIPVTFVGHPLVEQLSPGADRNQFYQQHQLNPELPIISLFPGSRKSEIKSLLQPMIQALPLIQERSGQKFHFILAKSPAISDEVFNLALLAVKSVCDNLSFRIISHKNHEILSLSQAALASSGTVTLEAALYNVPVVIAYKLSWFAYVFFKKFCYVRHIGLPNLLSDKPEGFLPELMMDKVTPEHLANAIQPYLSETHERKEAESSFKHIKKMLGGEPASSNVVHRIFQLMNQPLNPQSVEAVSSYVTPRT